MQNLSVAQACECLDIACLGDSILHTSHFLGVKSGYGFRGEGQDLLLGVCCRRPLLLLLLRSWRPLCLNQYASHAKTNRG